MVFTLSSGFNSLIALKYTFPILVAILILLFFGFLYNLYKLYRSKKIGKNLVKNKIEYKENVKTEIKDKNLIKNEGGINKDSDMKYKYGYTANVPVTKLTPKLLVLVSLTIILVSLLMPAISILGFQIDLYQIYQIIFEGIINNSLSLQSLIGSQSSGATSVPIFPLMLLGSSLILYITSIIVISLGIKFRKLTLPAGIISIFYSIFFIVGLNLISTISNIPFSVVGFGVYLGIVSGVLIIISYYIEKGNITNFYKSSQL